MLLEHDGGGQRGFETMHRTGSDHPAKAAERFAAAFDVIRQVVEPCLDRIRCPQTSDDAPFGGRERQRRRLRPISARKRKPS